MIKHRLLFLLIYLVPVTLFGQRIDRKMRIKLKVMNLKFEIPKHFTELDSGKLFPCGDAKILSTMFYTIINRDSTIRIGLAALEPTKPKDLEWIKKHFNPNFDPNKNYLRTAYSHADTVHHQLVFYSKEYSKQKFNADDSGEYSRNCTLPFEGKYNNHKIVFMAKRNRGHVELSYFYTDAARDRIDKVIKNTAGMIKFLD